VTAKKPKVGSVEALIKIRSSAEWGEIDRIGVAVYALHRSVARFRENHPPGHRCPACAHLRDVTKRVRPAGPFDLLTAMDVSLWNWSSMIGGDFGISDPG
jgi:hypothetical protein